MTSSVVVFYYEYLRTANDVVVQIRLPHADLGAAWKYERGERPPVVAKFPQGRNRTKKVTAKT